ncbi:MAG: hypothetical protein LBN42_02660 [Oscillospiraceae bacterium]|jgi:hypothetical protein|nr:hypothetical protein [Oscillospiraceae bacterium]
MFCYYGVIETNIDVVIRTRPTGIKNVHFEQPDAVCFFKTCDISMPECAVTEYEGFDEDELRTLVGFCDKNKKMILSFYSNGEPMAQIFKTDEYTVYHWSNEYCGVVLEPIHAHISENNPSPNGTKLWVGNKGKVRLVHNNSQIPEHDLTKLMDEISKRHNEIIASWFKYFENEGITFHKSVYEQE